MRMNHPDGKRLLATVRGGDYAHAGEEEAIRLAWYRLPKNPSQPCLDAGCGRGGTAALVQREGWGRVTGVDIDGETIAEARRVYPDGDFHAADIVAAGTLFPGQFEIIYAFNAVYSFPDQAAAFRSLAASARPGCQLCVFDYVDRGGLAESSYGQLTEAKLSKPLALDTVSDLLKSGGWQMTECREIHEEYRRWYTDLTRRFRDRHAELVSKFPEDLVDYAAGFYNTMLQAIEDGALGGAIVYGSRI